MKKTKPTRSSRLKPPAVVLNSAEFKCELISQARLQALLWGNAAGQSRNPALVPGLATFGATQAQHTQTLAQAVPMVLPPAEARPQAPHSTLESFSLPVLSWSGHVRMFEPEVDGTLHVGDVIKERYEIIGFLGEATTSRVVHCWDRARPLAHAQQPYEDVCVKVLHNRKLSLETGLHEIRVLQLLEQSLAASGRSLGDVGIVELKDYFYLAPHLFVVYQRLADDLYEHTVHCRTQGLAPYFTLERIRQIAVQLLKTLSYIHGQGVVHCDLKPENILFFSYSRCEIRLADLGHTSFVSEFPHYRYINSRSYRAPEVMLYGPCDARLDIWSLGAILAELLTGQVLFPHSNSQQEVVARMVDMCGPVPASVVHQARDASYFFTAQGAIHGWHEANKTPCLLWPQHDVPFDDLDARRQRLNAWLLDYPPEAPVTDQALLEQLIDFIARCLHTDYQKRPTAQELLEHAFVRGVTT